MDNYEHLSGLAYTWQRLDILKKAHAHNIEKGTALLATSLLNGIDGEKDIPRAMQLFNQLPSISIGYSFSINDILNLASRYHRGSTFNAVDYRLAVEWYEGAALRKHVAAQQIVGDIYRFGKPGVPADLAKAKEFYYLAAKQNDLRSMAALGKFVASDDATGTVAEKKRWYNLAVGQSTDGFPELQLGKLYRANGAHTSANGYFTQSAEKGNAEALNMLGLTYENGHGVKKDPVRAFDYFIVSATHNCPDAFYNLGLAYEFGVGVEENKDLAYAMYKHADTEFHYELAHGALQRIDPSENRREYDVHQILQEAAQHVALTTE
jgi:TPR repeat protein